jgi:hypothetical protein
MVAHITTHLVAEFERHVTPDTVGWTRAVEVALDRIARNADLSSLDEERILKFIVSASRGAYSVTTLRGELKKLRLGEISGTDHTEVAKAVIKDLEEFGKLKHHLGQFWQWKGASWQTVDQNDFVKHISEDYGSLPICKRYSDIIQVIKLMAGRLRQGRWLIQCDENSLWEQYHLSLICNPKALEFVPDGPVGGRVRIAL